VRQQLGIGDALPASECEFRQPRVGAIVHRLKPKRRAHDFHGCPRPSERAGHEVEGAGIAPVTRQQLAEDLAAVNRLGPTERGQLGMVLPLQPALPVPLGLAMPDVEEEGCLLNSGAAARRPQSLTTDMSGASGRFIPTT
jgi:hypothetical protein